MRNGHRILRRVSVSEAGSPTDFYERSEPGEHDIHFRLIEIPDIQERIHSRIRRMDYKFRKLVIPVLRQIRKSPVDVPQVAVFRL